MAWPKKSSRVTKNGKEGASKFYLKNLLEFFVKLWLLRSALKALFYFRFHFIICFFLNSHAFDDIFSSFSCSRIRLISSIALKLIENLSRNIWNYFLSAPEAAEKWCHRLFDVPFRILIVDNFSATWNLMTVPNVKMFPNLPKFTFKASFEGTCWDEFNKIDISLNIFYPLVKLNGNYFSLTIQHRRKFVTRCWQFAFILLLFPIRSSALQNWTF